MKIIETLRSDFPFLEYPSQTPEKDFPYFDYEVETKDELNIYHSTNVFIDDQGYVFNKMRFYPVSFFLRSEIDPFNAIKHIYKSLFTKKRIWTEEAIWVYDIWIKGYFHWFSDALQRYFQIVDSINRKLPIVLPLELKSQSYIIESLDLLEIVPIWIHPNDLLQVDNLFTIDYLPCPGTFTVKAMNSLRSKVLAKVDLDKNQKGRRIYISRSKAKIRKVTNEQELLPLIAAYGFEVVCLEDYNWQEQIKLLNATETILGLHGAGLTNMIWMPRGSQVIEIRMKSSFDQWCYFELAATFNHQYRYLISEPTNAASAPHNGDVIVDLKDLESQLQELVGILP